MSDYTYFIISPDGDRFVTDEDDDSCVYFKFGDSNFQEDDIIRRYKTTNPDFLVCAVMDSAIFGNLGTRLKHYIRDEGFPGVYPVVGTEWFWGPVSNVLELAGAMQQWDGETLTSADLRTLKDLIDTCLDNAGERRTAWRDRRHALQAA